MCLNVKLQEAAVGMVHTIRHNSGSRFRQFPDDAQAIQGDRHSTDHLSAQHQQAIPEAVLMVNLYFPIWQQKLP